MKKLTGWQVEYLKSICFAGWGDNENAYTAREAFKFGFLAGKRIATPKRKSEKNKLIDDMGVKL